MGLSFGINLFPVDDQSFMRQIASTSPNPPGFGPSFPAEPSFLSMLPRRRRATPGYVVILSGSGGVPKLQAWIDGLAAMPCWVQLWQLFSWVMRKKMGAKWKQTCHLELDNSEKVSTNIWFSQYRLSANLRARRKRLWANDGPGGSSLIQERMNGKHNLEANEIFGVRKQSDFKSHEMNPTKDSRYSSIFIFMPFLIVFLSALKKTL